MQAATPAALRSMVRDAGSRLRVRPAPSEWSALQCIAHIADAEVVVSGRYRFILAQDRPTLVGYDQDLWVDRLHSNDEDVESLLGMFEVLREANLALWRRSPQALRDRIGNHAERGPESFDLSFRMLAGHDRFHVAQAERALAAEAEGGEARQP